MGLDHADGYARRIRGELYDAFTEDHTPRETAGSFALGAFITMLPTLGTGFLLFAVIATAVGYVVVYRLAVRYASSDLGETIDETLEEVAGELLEP